MRQLLHSRITTLLLFLAVGWFGALAVGATLRARDVRSAVSVAETRRANAQREHDRIEADLARTQNPGWLALVARQRLNEKRPDESVVQVYPSEEESSTIDRFPPSTDKLPRWQVWWHWLIGK